MKASRRLAENDLTRGVTVKIQQVAVCGKYENPNQSYNHPILSVFSYSGLDYNENCRMTIKYLPKRQDLKKNQPKISFFTTSEKKNPWSEDETDTGTTRGE
jgi:hypothetical protein